MAIYSPMVRLKGEFTDRSENQIERDKLLLVMM